MPVEIKELVIRAVTTAATEESESASPAHTTPDDREALIQECVRQVLRMLRKIKER
jgi:hypothetical protein